LKSEVNLETIALFLCCYQAVAVAQLLLKSPS
jgi:hypothetical protein